MKKPLPLWLTLCVALYITSVFGRGMETTDEASSHGISVPAPQRAARPVQGLDNNNEPEACRNYRPGISNLNYQEWYGTVGGDGQPSERGAFTRLSVDDRGELQPVGRQTIARAAETMAPELTAALLSLLTSNETRIYLGNYESPPGRSESHDGLDGLRVIFQRNMGGRLVTAIMSYSYNATRRRMELNPGADSIRVRVEDPRDGGANRLPRTAGLSFATEMSREGNLTSFSPTVHFSPNGTRRTDSERQSEPHQCGGCHSAGRVKNMIFGASYSNTEEYSALTGYRSHTPKLWNEAYNATLNTERSPYQQFRTDMIRRGTVQNGSPPGSDPELMAMDRSVQAANARGTFLPPGLVAVLRQRCRALFARP